jgi:phospholipase/carboxylesterase
MPTNGLHEQGHLWSRPVRTPAGASPVGLWSLRSDNAGSSEGYLYVPADYRTETPAPLVLLLHGAGEDARDGLAQLRGQAEEPGIILLALSSRGPTWDSILDRGRYGADIAAIDRVLEHTFSRCAVDPTRVAVGGYSDGASYALSLGIANGDLFSHVLAFSPGFLAPTGQRGSPRIFVSHGTQDRWLPIDSCSRRIVPQLKRAGYEVRYREFEGGHVVPPSIAREAAIWLANWDRRRAD